MRRGDPEVRQSPSTGRAAALLAIASVVTLGAFLTIAAIWLDLSGSDLLELAVSLAISAALALTIGVFLLWVVDRAADGGYTTRLTISGLLTTLVFAFTAAFPVWRYPDSQSDRRLIWLMLGFAAVIAGLFALLAAWIDASPLRILAARSNEIASGHFEARLPETGNLEIAQTATAMNLLAARAQSSAIQRSNQDRARESLLLAIASDAQLPLDNIRAVAEAMSTGSEGEPVVTRRHLDALLREAAQLQRRIDEIEEFAHLESGQLTLRMQPVNLAQLIVSICDRLQPGAATRNVIISPRVDFSAPRVLVDPEQTLRALEGLMAYALSETPDGSQLSVEMRESGQFVQLAALELPSDEPPDVASRVRWESAHRRRESALSLAVAGRIIEIQGGSFLISRGNPGAPMVVVSLPRS